MGLRSFGPALRALARTGLLGPRPLRAIALLLWCYLRHGASLSYKPVRARCEVSYAHGDSPDHLADLVVALAREGSPWTSEELARRMDGWRVTARPLAFVLGGSHGLSQGFLASANVRWSLGPLTLPHELARVVVAEQLYRAFTILRGEPYHKGRA